MTKKEFQEYFEQLNDQERDVLHIATLFGDVFTLDNILDIIDIKPSKLLRFIDDLINQGLLRNKSKSIKGLFSFKNKRVIDYTANLMADEKRRMHITQMADYLERNLQDNEKAAVALSKLYLQCERQDKNFYHAQKAADLMVSVHKTEDAIVLYKNVINGLMNKKRIDMETPMLVESIVSYAVLAIYIRPIGELSTVITEGIALAKNLHNKRAVAMLEVCLCIFLRREGKAEQADAHRDKGWNIVRALKDSDLEKNFLRLIALSYFYEGKISKAIDIYEDQLRNIEEISSDLYATWSYFMLAWSYGITGRIGRGLGLAQAVIERARVKGFKQTETFSHGIIALILVEARRLEEAIVHVEASIEIGERINSDFILYMMKPCKAFIMYTQGDLKGARELAKEGLEHLQDTIINYPCPWFIELIFALHRYKWKPLPGHSFTFETKRLMNWPNKYMKGAALRYKALAIAHSEKSSSDILKYLQESNRLLHEAGAVIEAGRSQLEMAKYHIENGDARAARDIAKIVYQTYSEIDDTLFPSHMSNLIPRKSKEIIKNRGLSQIIKAIDLLPDIDKYLGNIVSTLTELFGAERAAILMRDARDKCNLFTMIATRNFTPEEIEQYQDPGIQNLLIDATRKGDFVLVSTRENDALLKEFSRKGAKIRSLALFPLIFDNNVNGIIYLDNRLLSGILSKNDVNLLKNLAIQISIAIKSVDIYSKSRNVDEPLNGSSCVMDAPDEPDTPFAHIIGKSKAFNEVLSQTRIVAATDTTVLIQGETGVGKELIAQAVHGFSKRKHKPFITVNVSALTPTLLESELFGHEKGAFTGADAAKSGRFEMANGGSLFLDEIGELSMAAQVKLLRVLQEGEFERVGSNRTIVTEFRLIAATNKNLKEMVSKGEFRSDLFYRINSFPIIIPPLRERKEDIQALAVHFLEKHSISGETHIPPSAMRQLEKYPWPGNVRELEHVIEKAVILSDGEDLVFNNLLSPPSGCRHQR